MTTNSQRDVRGDILDDVESIRRMENPDSTEIIPVIDIGSYLKGEAGALEEVAEQLHVATTTVGFFYLVGHGIPQALIDDVFEQARRLHSLTDQEKDEIKVFTAGTFTSGYQTTRADGYGSKNINIIKNAKSNLRAKFAINREGGSGDPSVGPNDPINVWPKNLPGFKEIVVNYHERIQELGRRFLPLWAKSLDLPIDFFDPFFKTPHATMNLLYYPPQMDVGDREYGIAPHTDNALMTFLATTDVPGLAIQMPSGRWKLAEYIPGTLLINTGNLMVRWTNGRYLSTRHRVINNNPVERYSIPVFFGPSADALIEVVPTCRGNQAHTYEPMTYNDTRRWYYRSE